MENFWLYLSMPLICGAVGYGTNWLCIKMMCYPIDFVGIPPWLGWQGILSRRVEHIAGGQMDVIMARLIDMKEMFGRIKAEELVEELDPVLDDMIEEITDELMMLQSPRIWESLPSPVKKRIYARARKDTPLITGKLLDDIQGNVDEVVDLNGLVRDSFIRDPALLVHFFQRIGYKEFAFVQNSGLWFGLLFGLMQMGFWIWLESPWVLPIAGVFVGYATNWLALNMIFSPKEPVKVGPFVIQGLFIKRKDEVAVDLGTTVTREILNPENIVNSIIRGPTSDRFIELIQTASKRTLDDYAGYSKPFVTLTVGAKKFQKMRDAMANKIIDRIPKTMKYVSPYAERALDIDEVIRTNMQKLTPQEFEGLLRPVFKADEWKLLLLGGVLGFLVGWFQLAFMFGKSLF